MIAETVNMLKRSIYLQLEILILKLLLRLEEFIH